MTLDMDSLVFEAHTLAVEKGWWDEALEQGPTESGARWVSRTATPVITPERASAKLMLIVTEVAEACECVRRNEIYGFRRESDDKPEGLPFELADIMIRVADLAGAYGIDLDAAIREKHEFNRTRSERHGGKAL